MTQEKSTIFDRLSKEAQDSVVCLGLDTRLEYLPEFLLNDPTLTDGEKIAQFNKDIIQATKDLVACYKVQIACYEALGMEGLEAYRDTLKAVREAGKIVIADVKRGDIAATAKEYAKGHFSGDFQADIITVNPYMGSDAISPYLDYLKDGKGIFVLLHTSNPGAQDFEELELIDNKKLFEAVGEKIDEWGEEVSGVDYQAIGSVVGLTYPEALLELSQQHPRQFLLVPGYGAQGGGAKDIAKILANGVGMVVNNSRGLITAHKGVDESKSYTDVIRQATQKMKEDINNETAKLV